MPATNHSSKSPQVFLRKLPNSYAKQHFTLMQDRVFQVEVNIDEGMRYFENLVKKCATQFKSLSN